MLNIMLKYLRNSRILLFTYLVIPATFILIGNLNLWFLSIVTFNFSFMILFDDLNYTIGLPVKRSDIINGNYLAYFILATINISYLFLLIYLVTSFLPYETDESFSLIGFLYCLNSLALYSLIIPFSIKEKISINYRWVKIYPAVGFLMMLPLLAYIDILLEISLIYHLIFTILFISTIFIYGYKDSLKTVELLDF